MHKFLVPPVRASNGLDLGENNRNINGCKTFAASIAQTLVDKQVQFQILSYKFFIRLRSCFHINL
jgi:hypothetical protein